MSIDCPDVFISLHSISQEQQTSYNQLYFLLNAAIDAESKATPQQIPKTIVFIDSIRNMHLTVMYFCSTLMQLTKSSETEYKENELYSVKEIVQVFNSRIVKRDQEIRFAEFMKAFFKIHIMMVTMSLGMGVNVFDVKRTVI